jgi:hypothetical protein
MPKLLLFVPCEKVIIAQDSNTLSLITILQELTINVPPDVQIPENAQVPMNWCALSLWHQQSGDEEKSYEQRVELCGPEGKVLTSATSQMKISSASHRVIAFFTGFPVGQFGQHTLKLYLREDKEGEERKEVASFPLTVKKS